MSNLARTNSLSNSSASESQETARKRIEKTFTEEIIIGLCSPIGTVKKPLIEQITLQLERDYGYQKVIVKKISQDVISKHYKDAGDELSRKGHSIGFIDMMTKINGGDWLREKYSKHSVLVEFVIADILRERTNEGLIVDPKKMNSRRVCYIIDSLKNKEELELLRSIYKDIFYMISVFSPEHERRAHLEKEKRLNNEKGEVDLLINTDDYENNTHGQNVRNTFVEADFFIRVSNTSPNDIATKVKRYLQLMFASSVVTPTAHEKAMYAAKSAAGNSACMSRQVGACITDREFNILSTGWNDVPKFGGGLYEEESFLSADGEKPKKADLRCWNYEGYCRNDRQKDLIVDEILKKLFEDTGMDKYFTPKAKTDNAALKKKLIEILRLKSPIKDLIEFSRAVHAEMHAIIAGCQKTGNQMQGGKLYCTTYPCHNCARHIIAAGIEEVYYIEPYVKSLGTLLHDDAITEDERQKDRVKILLYDGVAPRRFLEFFTNSATRKKPNGEKNVTNTLTQYPKYRLTLQALSTLENEALESLDESGLIPHDDEH